MPFGPLPEGTNLYIPTTLVIVVYMLRAIVGMRVKQNYFFGVRTSESLSDPEIWKEANKKSSFLTLAFTLPLLIANIIFAILKLPESFPGTILIIFAIGMIALNTYSLKYTQNLAKKKGVEIRKVKFPVYAVITSILITIALAIVWYLIWHLIFK